MRILHITPHLGGGIGKVVLYYVAKTKNTHQHSIVCLDYANDYAKSITKTEGIPLYENFYREHKKLLCMVKDTDIVLIHWTNHPLTYDLLVRETLPPSRVIMWSHVSGMSPPNIFTPALFDYADFFIFTTPISFNTKEVCALKEKQKDSLGVVWSTGGIDSMLNVKHREHKGFNVGYIGTVDYSKLHPHFLDMSSKISIGDANFIVIGESRFTHPSVHDGQLRLTLRYFPGRWPPLPRGQLHRRGSW